MEKYNDNDVENDNNKEEEEEEEKEEEEEEIFWIAFHMPAYTIEVDLKALAETSLNDLALKGKASFPLFSFLNHEVQIHDGLRIWIEGIIRSFRFIDLHSN